MRVPGQNARVKTSAVIDMDGVWFSGAGGRKGGLKIALFPCVGGLRDGPGGDHVQQVLAIALHSRRGLVGR